MHKYMNQHNRLYVVNVNMHFSGFIFYHLDSVTVVLDNEVLSCVHYHITNAFKLSL